MTRIRWEAVAGWYGLAVLGISLCAALLWALDGAGGRLAATAVAALAMFAPLGATVVMERLAPHETPLSWRPVFSRWLLVASALGLAVPLLTMVIGPLLPGAGWDWEMQTMLERFGGLLSPEEMAEARAQIEAMPVHPVILAIPQAVLAGASINALFAFGEEIGWRGWLHRELRPLGFWRSSGVTGLLWGFWHAPLIAMGHNYPTERVPGIFLFTVVCIGLSPLHSWVRERGDTVWAAALLHGTFNGAAGVSIMVVHGGELMVGVQGVAGVLAIAAANLGLALWLRGSGRKG